MSVEITIIECLQTGRVGEVMASQRAAMAWETCQGSVTDATTEVSKQQVRSVIESMKGGKDQKKSHPRPTRGFW